MINERLFFIQVLRDYLKGNQTLTDQIVDWKILFDIVKQQQLSAIFYYQTKNRCFLTHYATQLYYSLNQDQIMHEIQECLDKMGIQYVFVKGAVLKKYYKHPQFRSMGDLDLIVHEDDKELVGELLESIGFICDEGKDEWVYFKKQFEVELHHALVYEKDKFKYEADLNNFWDYVVDNELDNNFHFIYLLFHLRRHLLDNGVGFRQFLDIALMIENENVDWEWIEKFLQSIGMKEFAYSVFAVVNRCFQINIPIDYPNIDDDFYEAVLEKLFKDGVFGYDNDENNDVKGIARITCKEDSSILKARLKFTLNQLFPTYYYMKRLSYCKYVRKSKVFLPIAWGHRLIYRFKCRENRKYFIKRLTISNATIKDREDMIRQWGLK